MKLILVFFFIGCTAFFVSAEYAVIRSRISRIEQLIEEGSKKAKAVKLIVSRLDEYLSACQLGNTLTNLVLGWLGESTIEQLVRPLFVLLRVPESMTGVLSFAIAFLLLTFLEVVIGELVPKIFAIQKAEPLALLLARPLMIFFKVTYPFSWLLNRSARLVTGLFGLKPASEYETTHTEAELRLILSEGYKSGIINPSEFKYVSNIFELDDRVVKSMMVPRMDIVFVSAEDTVRDLVARMEEETYDSYPAVTGGNPDRVAGVVNIKDVIKDYIHGHRDLNATLQPYIKPVIQVIETISAQDLLLKMQKDDVHMAVLLDEYGGTSGLVTIKDIIKKIVGDENDERDAGGLPMVEKIADGDYLLSAKLRLEELNDLLNTNIEDDGVYTLGGWVMSKKYEIRQNDHIRGEMYDFIVKEMENHQIKRIEAVERRE